jgi:hypothetical protein
VFHSFRVHFRYAVPTPYIHPSYSSMVHPSGGYPALVHDPSPRVMVTQPYSAGPRAPLHAHPVGNLPGHTSILSHHIPVMSSYSVPQPVGPRSAPPPPASHGRDSLSFRLTPAGAVTSRLETGRNSVFHSVGYSGTSSVPAIPALSTEVKLSDHHTVIFLGHGGTR